MAGKPLSDEERARIVDLLRAGHTRGEVVRATGRSVATVSRIASAEGIPLVQPEELKAATVLASEVRRRKTAELAARLIEDAEQIRQQLWQPCTVWSFGGRDNTYNEQQLDRPDFAGQVKILTAVGIAVDKALKIDAADAGTGGEEAWAGLELVLRQARTSDAAC